MTDNFTIVSRQLDRLKSSMDEVSTLLKSAGEKAAGSSQEVGKCALRQAQQNMSQLFDTLGAMLNTRDPKEVTSLYTDFVAKSASVHAEQLREMSEVLAKSGREAWEPVNNAISSAMKLGRK